MTIIYESILIIIVGKKQNHFKLYHNEFIPKIEHRILIVLIVLNNIIMKSFQILSIVYIVLIVLIVIIMVYHNITSLE